MLKLVLEPGEGLDKNLAAAAKQLERLVEEGVREGYVRVRVYPRAELLVASAPLLSTLYSLGVKPLFKASLKPPTVIDTPTILLGYNNPNYKSSEVSSTLLSFSQEAGNPPPPSAVYVSGQGSVPAMLGLVMMKAGSAYGRRDNLLTLFSGVYLGGYVEKAGRMRGLDKLFYDALMEAKTGIELVSTFKVYKPMSGPLCQAVARTIDPYYPGLTGDADACVDLLEGNGAGDLALREAASLKRDELEKAALIILSHIRDSTGRDVEAADYVGGLAVVRQLGFDPRLRANSILYALDVEGDSSPIASASARPELVVDRLEDYHMADAPSFASLIEESKLVRVKVQAWVRGFKVSAPRDPPPLFSWRALRLSGRVDSSPLLFETSEGLCSSTVQVEEALGYGEARKLVEVKAAEEVGLRLCMRESALEGSV